MCVYIYIYIFACFMIFLYHMIGWIYFINKISIIFTVVTFSNYYFLEQQYFYLFRETFSIFLIILLFHYSYFKALIGSNLAADKDGKIVAKKVIIREKKEIIIMYPKLISDGI